MTTNAIGRFAPSPTGPLHFGSLVAAVASYLDARSRGGIWLVRMEDIDPPREVAGAAGTILRQLEAHGLCWDSSVLYQSSRTEAYLECLARLADAGCVYRCDCSRKMVMDMGGLYNGRCRTRQVRGDHSLRVHVQPDTRIYFSDLLQGDQESILDQEAGDFIVRRRDGLFSYQLAVAMDDAWQGITRVIRGSDLLDSTFRQLFLMQSLGLSVPDYGHIPVVTSAAGQKLSKQNQAQPAAVETAAQNLAGALAWLRHPPPPELAGAGCSELLQWAISAWQLQKIPRTLSLPEY